MKADKIRHSEIHYYRLYILKFNTFLILTPVGVCDSSDYKSKPAFARLFLAFVRALTET